MGRLVEEFFDMMNNLEDENDVQAVASPTYKKAVEDNEEIRKELPKKFKDFKKSADEFVKDNHNKDFKPKGTKGMKKMKLSESLFEAVAVMPKVSDDIYYKANRGALVDIIQDEITNGEVVYRQSPNGGWIPTNAPSLNIDYSEVGGDDETITVWAKDEDEARAVEEIAKKYGKSSSVKFDKYVSGDRKYLVTIHIDPEDWDEGYYDPNVQVRVDNRGRKRRVHPEDM